MLYARAAVGAVDPGASHTLLLSWAFLPSPLLNGEVALTMLL